LSTKPVIGAMSTVLLMSILLSTLSLVCTDVFAREMSGQALKFGGGSLQNVSGSPSRQGFSVGGEQHDLTRVDQNSTELVVGLQRNCYDRMKNLINRSGSKLISTVSMGGQVSAVVCDVPLENVSSFVDEAEASNLQRYIETNTQFHADLVPDDPYLDLEWSLKKIDAFSAWNVTSGSTQVLVAIVDTGVDYNHPDLARNYVALGYDWVNNDTDPMDDNGHGTHCAGIIAAGLNNSLGTAGVAQVRFFAEKGLDQYGSGPSDGLANAIIHAVDQGAKIISCSWGSYEDDELIHDAVRYAYNAGVLVIASAGNDAWSLKNYPAGYEEVVSVAATDKSDNPASFSNYGDWVDLSAPGYLIFSTMPNAAYGYMSGTSMSGPCVAGVAALVWSQFPNMTRDQVVQQMFTTADDLGDPGFDPYYGYGRVNARKAVQQTQPQSDVLILGWQKHSILYCRPDQPLAVNATIFNFGTSAQNNLTTELLVNGDIADSMQTVSLNSSASETLQFLWTPSSEGTYNVTVYVVPAYDENVTDNNALTMNVRVRAPRVLQVGSSDHIQNAVDAAFPGDTVHVSSGTYHEHLTVTKSISLVGGDGTVVDGNGAGTVLNVLADAVNITGFTVRNGDRGVCLNCSNDSTVADNVISDCSEGLVLFHSGNNRITNNSMSGSDYDFCVEGDFEKYTHAQFVQDMDSSNTVHGKPVYYWVGQHDKQVPNDAGYVALVDSTNVTIRNISLSHNSQGVLIAFTAGAVVTNTSVSQNQQGVLLAWSSDTGVAGNMMRNDDVGIDVVGSLNITVAGNTVRDGSVGISLRYSSDNNVSNNTIASNNDIGILLDDSSANQILNNTLSNSDQGLKLESSGICTLRDNHMAGNTYNFGAEGVCLQDFVLDMDTSNTADGKLVYYLVAKHDLLVNASTFPDAGYLAIINCTNMTVRELNLTHNSQGILLAYTNDSTIEKMNVSSNEDGIFLFSCDRNNVRDNVASANDNDGIYLRFSSNNNVTSNTAASNGLAGAYLSSSGNNRIRSNTFSETTYGFGVVLEDSARYNLLFEDTVRRNLAGIVLGVNEPHGNKIYYNNFVDNQNQMLDLTVFWSSLNTWDDGKGQGNYWSSYTGRDTTGDGIGDTNLPYLNVDQYPLMTRYWNQADVNHDGKVNVVDLAVVARAFGAKKGDPNWNEKSDLDNNGKVNVIDISLVAVQYGKTA
jgi:thermitase